MKPWTGSFIAGIVITVALGLAIALVSPFALFFWVSGIFSGYGLRIGIVDMWPHIFRPRIAYKAKQNQPVI